MPLRVTPRDLDLIEDVGQAVVVEGATLRPLHFADDSSGKSFIRRLGRLCDAKLLRAFDHPLTSGRGGAPPRVYCLAPDGADLLRTHGRQPPLVTVDKTPNPLLLNHRLLVGRCILATRKNLAKFPDHSLRWLLEQQTVPGLGPTASYDERFILHTIVQTPEGPISLRPDLGAWLTIAPAAGQPQAEVVLYWEADNGTDKPAQLADKVRYTWLAAIQAYRKHWPEIGASAATVRVLFVCHSPARRDTLLKLLTPLLADESLYRLVRVAAIEDIESVGPLSGVAWYVPKLPAPAAVPLLQQPAA